MGKEEMESVFRKNRQTNWKCFKEYQKIESKIQSQEQKMNQGVQVIKNYLSGGYIYTLSPSL